MDEESIYVIRLSKDSSACYSEKAAENLQRRNLLHLLPSERRYSASLVLGLGVVHVIFGALSAVFALMALFVEPEVNRLAAGLWSGIVYLGCGIFGILANTKWYVRHQILWFLFASIFALICSLVVFSLTIYGLYERRQRIQRDSEYFRIDSFHRDLFSEESNFMGDAVTANILITALLEFAWSLFSLRISIKGYLTEEYEFDSERDAKPRCQEFDADSPPTNSNPHKRHEYVLSAKLPPGYSASGILADPSFICHLTEKEDGSQYHVSRANPICKDGASNDDSTTWTTSTSPTNSFPEMSEEEKAILFLGHSAELAAENAGKISFNKPESAFLTSYTPIAV